MSHRQAKYDLPCREQIDQVRNQIVDMGQWQHAGQGAECLEEAKLAEQADQGCGTVRRCQ